MRSRTPTLRELHETGFPRTRRATPRRYAYLDEDPDLAPPARKEAPLSCWA